MYSVYRASPASVGFAQLSAEAVSMSNGDQPVPSATIGSVASVTPTSTGSNGGSGRSGNGALSSVQIPSALVLSSLLGGLLAVFGAL